jgi:tetratricopeptide (TPR) repeat protein
MNGEGRSKTSRALALPVVVALAAVALLFGGVFADGPGGGVLGSNARAAADAADQDSLNGLVAGFSTGNTAGYVRGLEQRVAKNRDDGDALTLLALAYQQRARETGDPAYYRLSGAALARASAAGGRPELVFQARASLANTRHRFRDGLALAHRALRLDRLNGSAYGALGDAELNLGRYRAAFAAYDRMAELSPGIASYTRVANARELLGRRDAAVEALRLALQADSTVPEQVAWALVQLGNVELGRGRLAPAATAYRRALRQLPGYVHAEAGIARVEAARGSYARAAARLRDVVARLPIPAYVILLGDILHVSGHEAAARREYGLVRVIERLFEANGVRTELQTAVFDLDHGRNPGVALARARAAFRSAPGVYADDAVAWGLFRLDRCREAKAHSIRSLRLGTRDALLFFHRGMIERCLGDRASARAWFSRALALNPHFSLLWAPLAKEALR